MKKSRFLYLHQEANPRKIASLEALQAAYSAYLEVCVESMLRAHKFSLSLKEKRAFFPPSSETLSNQIVKNVQDHAISIISGWAASKYTTKLRSVIRSKFKDREINEDQRFALCILGKRLVDKSNGKITQEAIDLYWSWLLDEAVVGKTPTISAKCGMRMTEMTSVLSRSEETRLSTWWLRFSHLDSGKPRIQLPLVANPYVFDVGDVSKGILARKTKQGRWRFEVVERKEWEIPNPCEDAPKIGVDVGLNVMAATSEGELLGCNLKPKFNSLYSKVKTLRANRQRQNLRENSLRLDKLESKLTGFIKTLAGECSNKLVRAHPGAIFVVEDLDLRGCRGQKRFAYRALHRALESKAPTIVVNPAFTSQMCPSCGYVSKKNREGVKFRCRGCGRKGHSDVVGGINLLGRSEDKQVSLADHPSGVKAFLRERYRARRRDSSLRKLETNALEPSSRRLTVGASKETSIASNQVETLL